MERKNRPQTIHVEGPLVMASRGTDGNGSKMIRGILQKYNASECRNGRIVIKKGQPEYDHIKVEVKVAEKDLDRFNDIFRRLARNEELARNNETLDPILVSVDAEMVQDRLSGDKQGMKVMLVTDSDSFKTIKRFSNNPCNVKMHGTVANASYKENIRTAMAVIECPCSDGSTILAPVHTTDTSKDLFRQIHAGNIKAGDRMELEGNMFSGTYTNGDNTMNIMNIEASTARILKAEESQTQQRQKTL